MANPFMMDDPFEVQGQHARVSVAVSANDGQPVHAAAVSPNAHNGGVVVSGQQHGMADVQFQGGYAYPAQAAVDVAGAAVHVAGQAAAYGYAAQPVYADYPTANTGGYVAQPVHVSVQPTASAPPEDTPPVTSHAPAPGSGIAVHYHTSMSAGVSASAPPILDETSPTLDERKEVKAQAAAVLATVSDFPDLTAAMSRPDTKDVRDKGRFIIMVTDPEKKGDGMVGQFVAYKISTMKEFNGSTTQSTVFRRFSDFYWLHDRLAHRYKGCLIPPVPDKAMMGRFTQEFIQERRRGLEIFLNRVAVHRELRDSEDVDVFLHAVDDNIWSQHKAKKEKEEKAAAATNPDPAPPAKRGIMTFFKETVQSISNSVGSGKSRPKSEGDLMCDKIQQYADALDTQFTSVHAHVDLLIKRERGLARTWFDFGNACTLLGQYESGQKQAELGAVLAHLGNCADRLSIMLGKKADTENVNFREPFRDYMRIIGAVKAMLKSRSAVLLSYQTAQTTLESRQAKLAELQGKPNKAAATAAAETAVQVAQVDADNAQRELTRVTDLTLHETQRFRAEKHKDLRQVIIEFVKLQAEDAKASARAWDGILEEIQK